MCDLYMRETRTSLVNPIPPQYWRQESVTSLASRPAFSLIIEASWVTSLDTKMLSHVAYIEAKDQ